MKPEGERLWPRSRAAASPSISCRPPPYRTQAQRNCCCRSGRTRREHRGLLPCLSFPLFFVPAPPPPPPHPFLFSQPPSLRDRRLYGDTSTPQSRTRSNAQLMRLRHTLGVAEIYVGGRSRMYFRAIGNSKQENLSVSLSHSPNRHGFSRLRAIKHAEDWEVGEPSATICARSIHPAIHQFVPVPVKEENVRKALYALPPLPASLPSPLHRPVHPTRARARARARAHGPHASDHCECRAGGWRGRALVKMPPGVRSARSVGRWLVRHSF